MNAAKRIYERVLQTSDARYAVIDFAGTVSTLLLDAKGSERLERILRDFPGAVVGIYDHRAQRQWIEDDLR